MKNRIKELRIERGVNQNELAKKVKITSRQLSDIELGKSDTKTANLKSIAAALETTVSYLIYESDAKTLKR